MVYMKGDYDQLYEKLIDFCVIAQDDRFIDIQSDFTIDFYDKPTSFLHQLYISKKIEYLSCVFIKENDLIAVSAITFESKTTARFAEYLFILPQHRSKLKGADVFIPEIKIISGLGLFEQAICQHKNYKQIVKRYFTKMAKVKALENIVISNGNVYGVYLNKNIEKDMYRDTLQSNWRV